MRRGPRGSKEGRSPAEVANTILYGLTHTQDEKTGLVAERTIPIANPDGRVWDYDRTKHAIETELLSRIAKTNIKGGDFGLYVSMLNETDGATNDYWDAVEKS